MKLTPIILAGAILASSGCASGLNSYQKSELRHYEAAGLARISHDRINKNG